MKWKAVIMTSGDECNDTTFSNGFCIVKEVKLHACTEDDLRNNFHNIET